MKVSRLLAGSVLFLAVFVSSAALVHRGPFVPTVAFAACAPVKMPSSETAPVVGFDTDAHIMQNFNTARTAEGCTTALTLPGNYDTMDPQHQMVTLFNLERTDRGFGSMQLDTGLLSQVALNHSREIKQYNYFEHFSPINQPLASNGHPDDGGFLFNLVYQRETVNPVLSTGPSCPGEDIAEGTGIAISGGGFGAFNAAAAVYSYMYQDAGSGWGHRITILGYLCSTNTGGDYDWIGIGVVYGGNNVGDMNIYTDDFFQDTPNFTYNPAVITALDNTPPSLTNLSYNVGTSTASVTASDSPPDSTHEAGVTNVTFYVNSIVDNNAGNGGSFSTVWASQAGNVHSGNGTYTANITVNGGDTLHAVATDGAGNFTDCTALGCTNGPTAAFVIRFIARQHKAMVTFHWRVMRSIPVAGFDLYAGLHRLNAHVIPIHRGATYAYRTAWHGHGPYTLHLTLRNGQQVNVPSR